MDEIARAESDLQEAFDNRDVPAAVGLLSTFNPRDLSRIISRTSPGRAAVLFRLLTQNQASTVFEMLSPGMQSDLVVALRGSEVSALVAHLHTDDRVGLLDELPGEVAERLYAELPADIRLVTDTIRSYPASTVGRRMSPEYVSTHPRSTVGDTLAEVTAKSRTAETIYVIPVTDDAGVLVGVVTLRDLIENPHDALVADLLVPAQSVRADVSAEIAARVCTDSELLALPVVDDSTRLLGIFTLDDALRTLRDAETEDMARAGGAEPIKRPYLAAPVLRITRSRVVWLLVLAVSALLTVQVLGVFEATLEQKVVLALFIPLLTGTGGNTGSQAATTVTRALAVGDVRPGDVGRVLFKEVRVGAMLGLLLGALGFIIAYLVYDLSLGTVIGLTLLLICTIAATVGGAMPMLARFIRVDPAVFSTPFITTFCDATGLVIYFTLAKLVLGI